MTDIYNQLIHSTRWQRLRRRCLNAHPLCQCCEAEGRAKSATEVHHITPVESGVTRREQEELCYNPHNLQALCHECHVHAHDLMGRSGKQARKRLNEEHRARIFAKLFG